MNSADIGKLLGGAGAVLIAVSIECNGDLKNIMFTSGTFLVAVGVYIANHKVKKIEIQINNKEQK